MKVFLFNLYIILHIYYCNGKKVNWIKKHNIILLLILLNSICSAQQFDWIKYSSGDGPNLGYHIAVDRFKNSYVTGIFSDTASFGNVTLIKNMAGSNIFLLKYDSTGNYLWAQQLGNLGNGTPHGLKVDSAGNCYVAGDTGGIMVTRSGADSTTIKGKGGVDIFLAKYNTNGSMQWIRSPGSKKNDYCRGIAVDNSGNVFINGWVNDTATFGGGQISKTLNLARGAMVTAKYDNNGNFIWVQIAKADNDDPFTLGGVTGYGVGVDKTGNSYICGSTVGANTFIDSLNNFHITSPLNRDPFIAKYSPSGDLLWVTNGINGGSFRITSFDSDDKGNSYLCGNFDGSIVINGTNINDTDGHILLMKLNRSGNVVWAKGEGKTTGGARSIVARDDGSCYVTGAVSLPAVFGTDTNQQSITGSTAGVSFVAKYDSTGNLSQLIPVQSIYKYDSYGVDIDNTGSIYITGLHEVGIIGNVAVAKLGSGAAQSISELNSNINVSIYPNPADGIFQVYFNSKSQSNIVIKILNATGQIIYKTIVEDANSSGGKTIDLSKQAKGVYFVEMIAGNERSTKKIVIE